MTVSTLQAHFDYAVQREQRNAKQINPDNSDKKLNKQESFELLKKLEAEQKAEDMRKADKKTHYVKLK